MARELKSFTIEGCSSYLPTEILSVLGTPSHVRQGSIYVLAYTKKDAAERLSAVVGWTVRPSHLSAGTGDQLDAVASATSFYGAEGDLIAMHRSKIAASRSGQWLLIGETTYKIPGELRLLNKPVFVPVEKPAEPVRITIELDETTDPRVVEALRAAQSVFVKVAPSPVGLTALGKVVQP